MRSLLVLGSLLLISVFTRSLASPYECRDDSGPVIVTEPPPVAQCQPDQPPAGPRTVINTDVSRNASQVNTKSKTKSTEKIKTKERKDGTIVTFKIDKTKTRNETDAVNDSYDQSNCTVTAGGVEDHTSLTKEKQQQLKQVSVAKNVTKEKIVTDKYGNVISDTVKAKSSTKEKKSEKTKESEQYIHTVKQVTTKAPGQCVTVPPTPPCDTTTTTTKPPPCDTTTTTTEPPPCDTTTTTAEPPTCDTTTTTTTTTEPPVCDTTTTTTEPPVCETTTTTTEPPVCDTTTTTTEPPTCDTTTTTTAKPPPCDTTTTTAEPPTCDTTTTTTAEPPRLPCGCRRTTTTTEGPPRCGSKRNH